MSGLTAHEETVDAVLRVNRAMGMTASTQKDITQVLREMTGCLADQDVEGWSRVFTWLGELHPGTNRFNIIRAILMFWQAVADVQRWGATWMTAIELSGIHPVSLCLCTAGSPNELRLALLDEYERNFPALGYPVVVRFDDARTAKNGDDPRSSVWTIQIPSGQSVKNVVSSHRVDVWESSRGATISLGDGWCVQELRCCEMPALASLGPNMVVMTDLNLLLAPGVKVIREDSRIGGMTRVWKPGFPAGTTRKRALPKGNWDMNTGWVEAEDDWKSNWRGNARVVGPPGCLPDPIVFPDSWFCLFNGFWKNYRF